MSFVPTVPTTLNPWVRILGALEKKINRQSFETWLKPTRFSHISGKKLFVRIPTPEFQHVGDRYGDLIQEAIDNLQLEFDEVAFITPEEDPTLARVREALQRIYEDAQPQVSNEQNKVWDILRRNLPS